MQKVRRSRSNSSSKVKIGHHPDPFQIGDRDKRATEDAKSTSHPHRIRTSHFSRSFAFSA